MKVNLAGYNIDADVIEELKKNSPERQDITPETLSASYARISRDPRPIDELRKSARQEVEKSRNSNSAIIFKMGHHSVAEHAVFNFDVIGVSRLALEALEKFRLSSYTEKSQRYITLTDDFVIPEEIEKAGFTDLFVDTIKKQNAFYHSLYEELKNYIFGKHPDMAKDPKQEHILDGWAKEDARYVVALATQGQVGVTLNARNLELLFRRFASHNLAEVRALGIEMYKAVEQIAPSIILFTKANDFDEKTYRELRKLTLLKVRDFGVENLSEVELIDYTLDGDLKIVAALMHAVSHRSYAFCMEVARGLTEEQKLEIIKRSCQYMEFYDSTLREFEYADLTFNLIVSSACFGQLKRHRMASISSQPYDPAFGFILPESIVKINRQKDFEGIIQVTNEAYKIMYEKIGDAAAYVLTNSHRRRVLFKTNARELYHFSRLREDSHSQWDIRNISAKMSHLAKKVMPLSFCLLGGKDQYPKVYEGVYGQSPKILP